MVANTYDYLLELCREMVLKWPENGCVNIVSHGHSVPAGYFATPYVNTFHAYPHLLHRAIKEKFPFAVTNVIVTAIGGENAEKGCARFAQDVLCHRPDVVTIDYGLNDRGLSLRQAEAAWRGMITAALENGVKVILLTPSWDLSYFEKEKRWHDLTLHAEQIRALADEYGTALADSFAAFEKYIADGGALQDLLSHVNHPSLLGHQLICRELSRWFFEH